MSYAVRNTIIIAAFWALVLGAGFFYLYGHQDSVHQRLLKQKLQKFKQVTELQDLERDLTALNEYYGRLQEISQGKRGLIASKESPGETYDYILREIKRNNSSLDVNLAFEREDSLSSVVRRNYKVDGEGRFTDIYRLLWLLENGPVFYDVQSLSIDRISVSDETEKVTSGAEARFTLSLAGYNRKEGPAISEIVLQNEAPKQMAELIKTSGINVGLQRPKTNALRMAAAQRPVPAERPALINKSGLPEVSPRSKVLAITPFSIMIVDEKGKVVKLRKGDKIFGGYLREINTQNNQAVFELDNIAGQESLVLTVASQKMK
jgi:hypothetical protein